MEGRRVSRRRPRRNPLYVIFMALLAAALVLLVVSIVLGVKLRGARRDLADAQTKIEQLQNGGTVQTDPLPDDPSGGDGEQTDGDTQGDVPQTGSDTSGTQTNGQSSASSDKIDWLDLTGHSEISVKPGTVYDKYYVYYTSAGVNLRAGPGTSYDKVKLVDLGTEVKAAAKQDGWTFVLVGDKFGWINSDYLSTTRPEPKPAATSSSSTASSGSTGTASGTAGGTDTATGTTGSTDTTASSGSGSSGNEMPDWLRNDG